MPYNAVLSGPPNAANSPYPASGATNADAIDTNAAAEWVSISGQGWTPVSSAFAKAVVLNTTAAQPSLLVVKAPQTGLYIVNVYASQATSTNGTPPQFQIAYTEADTGVAISTTSFGTPAATTGQGQSNNATTTINAKGGTTITISSLAPTTLTANVKARISYLG
jgi:hypothetical protein